MDKYLHSLLSHIYLELYNWKGFFIYFDVRTKLPVTIWLFIINSTVIHCSFFLARRFSWTKEVYVRKLRN